MSTEALGLAAVASATFTTPAGTTAYSAGDLIADNATGASITPLTFEAAVEKNDALAISRVRLKTQDAGFAGKLVNFHLYQSRPTVNNGDNGAFGAGAQATESGKVDVFNVTFSSVATSDGWFIGSAVPASAAIVVTATEFNTKMIYGLLESVAAATPVGAKLWVVVLEIAGRR